MRWNLKCDEIVEITFKVTKYSSFFFLVKHNLLFFCENNTASIFSFHKDSNFL